MAKPSTKPLSCPPISPKAAPLSLRSIQYKMDDDTFTSPHQLYRILKNTAQGIVDDELIDADLAKHLKQRVNGLAVSRMSTSTIIKRLQRFGVDISEESFSAHANEVLDAWTLSERWLEQTTLPLRAEDDDFLGLAATELWLRLLPEAPCPEVIDDYFWQSFIDIFKGHLTSGIASLELGWTGFKTHLLPETTRLDHSSPALQNFYTDLPALIRYRLLDYFDEAIRQDLAYADQGIAFTLELLELFPDEAQADRVTWESFTAYFMIRSGNKAQGETVYLDLIKRYPQEEELYLELSAFYFEQWRQGNTDDDWPSRTYQTLNNALANFPQKSPEYRILKRQLNHMKTDIESQTDTESGEADTTPESAQSAL